MEEKLTSVSEKLFSNKIWMYIKCLLITGLFAFMVKGLADYDTALYQTEKYFQADVFVFSFVLILFLIRKVKLINIPSLIATIIFIPIAYSQVMLWVESPDIQKILKIEVVAEWVVLMLIIDMLLYRNINLPGKENYILMFIYVILCTAMIFHRNGRNDPLYLVIPLGLFMLIKIDKKDWEELFRSLLGGFFLFFVFAVIKSFVTTPYKPYTHQRYYGYFTNIGAFGMFLSCVFVCALTAILYSKEKYGRKSVFYIVSWLWMISCCIMLWLTNTMTLFAGIFMTLVFWLLIARKDTSRKALIKRLLIIFGIILAFAAICLLIYLKYGHVSEWGLHKLARRSGYMAPFYSFVERIVRVTNRLDRSSFKSFVFSLLDTFSSNRMTIIKAYSEYFNFTGNNPIGYIYLENIDYYAVSAHNNYVQVIVDYGYVASFVYFAFVLISLGTSIKKFWARGKKTIDLLPVLWIAMCLGVWLGEACGFTYPATFVMLILICRMISSGEEGQEEISQ